MANTVELVIVTISTGSHKYRDPYAKCFLIFLSQGKKIFPLFKKYIPRENHNSKRPMHPNIHCIAIYNSQDMEASQMSFDRGMDEEDVVHINSGILIVKVKATQSCSTLCNHMQPMEFSRPKFWSG